ncbi:MAG: STAS domain-containing protein [Candidatus Sumerlaeia bacterium]|nr:STAS domain-containing protein [Candidatus Sumerlaeia bacterium]
MIIDRPGAVLLHIARAHDGEHGVELVFEGNDEKLNVKVIGDIVADSAGELRESILQLLSRKPEEICLDLAEMPFIDTSGLGVLIGLRTHLKKHSVKLTIINPQDRVLHVFRLTQISKLFGME